IPGINLLRLLPGFEYYRSTAHAYEKQKNISKKSVYISFKTPVRNAIHQLMIIAFANFKRNPVHYLFLDPPNSAFSNFNAEGEFSRFLQAQYMLVRIGNNSL